jgi:F0F1-type ATP synthase assembly protein I
MSGSSPEQPPSQPPGDAWTVVSYLISGPLLYGGIAWLLDRWLHQAWIVPVGVLVGMTLALVLVYLRFGRQ